ncbi:hypothetical protein [Pseudomonas sp. UBA2684]|nr:hypothetical protein [Pseudomonas sp. UBA2684]|tara:strand:+ start:22187 stop:22330 length:144 start_codon:yes stop_codon:yes gene_type:complete
MFLFISGNSSNAATYPAFSEAFGKCLSLLVKFMLRQPTKQALGHTLG